MRVQLPLPALSAATRAAGALSRLAGTGGGTTLPGKLLWKLDPTAVSRLAARLPQGSAALSATNGKTTTAAMTAEILGPRVRLAHNRSGANLLSGIASTLLAADGAELGLFEVDEAALPQVVSLVRPRVLCLGNLFRDQLDRYGELELIAERWRALVRELLRGGDARRQRRRSAAGRPRCRTPRRSRLRDRRPSPRAPWRPAARGRLDALRALWDPYRFHAAYVGHLGDYECLRCGHRRPALTLSAAAIELDWLDGASFDLRAPGEERRVTLRLPGLYNVYNALAALRCPRPRRFARRDRLRTRALRRGLRTLRANRDGRPRAADAPDQEPRRRERGGADARCGCAPHARGRRAERRDRRRKGRVLDLGRRFRAPARRARARHRHGEPRGGAGAPLQICRVRPRGDRGRPVARARPRSRARRPPRAGSSSCSRPTPRCSRSAGSSPSAATCRSTG